MPIIANLVVGRDGATTSDGRSSPLSSGSDRERFRSIRSQAELIVIGGNTSRSEPYAQTPVPLVVISHSDRISGSAAKNPYALLSNSNIAETLKEYSERFETILVEGGSTLLLEALQQSLIDTLYLTKTERIGEAPYFQIPSNSGLTLTEELTSSESQELFLTYARLPR